MGTSVTFKILKTGKVTCEGSDTQQLNPAYKEGQIIFAKEERKIYLDFGNERTCYTPEVPKNNGLNYLGIAQTPPTKDGVLLNGHTEPTVPHINDMVVYETKEYLFRDGDNGADWYEIGDEETPSWNLE